MREPDMRVFTGNKLNKVFVYGTLKKTYGNHNYLRDCTYIEDDTLKGYMFHYGGFPAFVPEVTGQDIMGEVYSFDPDKNIPTLGRLDSLEGVPTLYWRLPFLTQKGHAVWAYWMPHTRITTDRPLIHTGKWIGKNSPTSTFGTYLGEHRNRFWPRKPKMSFHPPAQCVVVMQDVDNQKELMEYVPLPEQKQIALVEKYSTSKVIAKVEPLVPKKQENGIEVALEWLGSADDKEPTVCHEYHVEGI